MNKFWRRKLIKSALSRVSTILPTERELAIARLWREIEPCLVFCDRKLDIEASARKWFWYRRTDPPYFKEHWVEYNDLAYTYLYPFLYLVTPTWAAEYEKIDKRPGSEDASKRPYVLFQEAF